MLSKTWGYSVRALSVLATTHDDPKRRWSSEELADKAGLPASFLAKVLQELHAAGLTQSVRGRGGGVRLARDPSEIRLSEIAAVTEDEEPFRLEGAGLEDAAPALAAEINRRWTPYRRAMREFLSETTLADLSGTESFQTV
jgi:Rrf2 family protein